MNQRHSKWETKELTQTYLEGVRGAIPGASFQLEVLSKIISIWCPLPSKILDLGCGDGILGRVLLDANSTAQVTFIDVSDPMLEALRNRIGDNPRATAARADFGTPDWIDALEDSSLFDVIVSGFAIHHQPNDRKKDLYAEIYGLLREGGVFLNLDHVSSATPSGTELFDSFFIDHLRRFLTNANPGESTREIEEAYYCDKKDNILAPVGTQCQWLRDLGFLDVDCFFKTFELALFGGRRASNKSVWAEGI